MKQDLFKLKATIDCYYLEGIMEDIGLPLSVRTWNCIFPEAENGSYYSFGLADKDITSYKNDIEWFKDHSRIAISGKEIVFAESMIELIYELRKYVSDTEVLVYCWF